MHCSDDDKNSSPLRQGRPRWMLGGGEAFIQTAAAEVAQQKQRHFQMKSEPNRSGQ